MYFFYNKVLFSLPLPLPFFFFALKVFESSESKGTLEMMVLESGHLLISQGQELLVSFMYLVQGKTGHMLPTTGFSFIRYVKGRYSREHCNCLVRCFSTRTSASELPWYLATIKLKSRPAKHYSRDTQRKNGAPSRDVVCVQDKTLCPLIAERTHTDLLHP